MLRLLLLLVVEVVVVLLLLLMLLLLRQLRGWRPRLAGAVTATQRT